MSQEESKMHTGYEGDQRGQDTADIGIERDKLKNKSFLEKIDRVRIWRASTQSVLNLKSFMGDLHLYRAKNSKHLKESSKTSSKRLLEMSCSKDSESIMNYLRPHTGLNRTLSRNVLSLIRKP